MVLQRLCTAAIGKSDPTSLCSSFPQPNICVLLDVGTRPAPKSLYYLWKTFDLNSNVGGAAGEIAAFKGKAWRSLLNPLGKRSKVTTSLTRIQSQHNVSNTKCRTFWTSRWKASLATAQCCQEHSRHIV